MPAGAITATVTGTTGPAVTSTAISLTNVERMNFRFVDGAVDIYRSDPPSMVTYSYSSMATVTFTPASRTVVLSTLVMPNGIGASDSVVKENIKKKKPKVLSPRQKIDYSDTESRKKRYAKNEAIYSRARKSYTDVGMRVEKPLRYAAGKTWGEEYKGASKKR